MDNIIYGPIHGAQRILTVFDDHIRLEQVQNFRSFLTNDFFNGDKDIYYFDMISCQFKEGSSIILGYLQFEVYGAYHGNNFGSENSFTFEYELNRKMFDVYQYVKNRIREIKTGGNIKQNNDNSKDTSNNDIFDELLKLKRLKDENIITNEEYEKLKSNILKNI